MDDRRFDAMVRSLASGGSRRQVLKGLLGLGGAVAAGSAVLDADAARRPTPTPVQPKCPNGQHWDGSACMCDSGTNCGPECCGAGGTCCDNACCYGYCYGEELCCPTGRSYCPVSGECCPEGWECCPEYGCISPTQCCTAEDCSFLDCSAAVCTAEHICQYVDNCTAGQECCQAENCYVGNCQDDGTCGEPVFDCSTGSECCAAAACYRSDCQEGGSCSRPTPDCRRGDNCCGSGNCNLNTGICCTPLTCADLDDNVCGGSDGCGGTLSCPGNCDDRLSCVGNYCVNTTTTCYEDFACGNTPLSRCATDGFCLKNLGGTLVCVSGTYYPFPGFPACGDCTNDAQCRGDGGDPSGICLLNAVISTCGGCPQQQGDGCGLPVS